MRLKFGALTILTAFYCGSAYSQSVSPTQSPLSAEKEKIGSTQDPRLRQSYEIIDDIKAQSSKENFKFEFRSGLMQIFSSSVDSIGLNGLKTIPFLGVETVTKLYENLGFDLRGYYALNFLFAPDPGSRNKADASQHSYELGPRYRFILDPTQRDDYVAVKLLYHYTENNFKLSDPLLIFMKSYTGVVTGVERSIPVTPRIGIVASLDLNFIQDAKSDSSKTFENTGLGFNMRGAANYRVDWFGMESRVSGAYWQGGFVNRLSPETQASGLARAAHVQTYRAVSLSYLMNF